MRRSALAALLVATACSRPSNTTVPRERDAAGAIPEGVGTGNELSVSTSPGALDGGAAEPAVIRGAYLTALPAHGKSIGHTSVAFKLGLAGGLDVAYKPRSHRGGERFHGEIAAYRLAVVWGLDNVPPAVPRSFPADALRSALDEKAADLFSQEVVAETDGTVRGALIPWIPKLEFLQLESGAARAQWSDWLDGAGTLTDCDAALASQISSMILFDTMSGNWDRWSGGNIGVARGANASCDRVLFIDNDGAFFDPVPAAPLASQLALVKKMKHFSKHFVSALRSVSEADLEKAIGEEMPGRPLLPRPALDGFFARRKTVLAGIEGKIASFSEATTLSLP